MVRVERNNLDFDKKNTHTHNTSIGICRPANIKETYKHEGQPQSKLPLIPGATVVRVLLLIAAVLVVFTVMASIASSLFGVGEPRQLFTVSLQRFCKHSLRTCAVGYV